MALRMRLAKIRSAERGWLLRPVSDIQDIGKIEATSGSENRLFIIAGMERIRSETDENGPCMVDEKSDLMARPGDAIDAEIIFSQTSGGFDDTLAVGWSLDFRCGRGLAKVFSISRVHR